MTQTQIAIDFKNYFNTDATPAIFSAPGRVNLIGEHTDYNNGFVLPMAIEFKTTLALYLRDDDQVRVYSANLKQEAVFSLTDPVLKESVTAQWFCYIAGVLALLMKAGFILRGADIYIHSTVPIGAGLSSSASLTVATAYAFLTLLNYPLDLIQIAKICQQAEHDYAGTQCGIMDQYICALAAADHALLIDCANLEAVKIPLHMENAIFVICDTGVHHNLASSEYNIRRAQCEKVAHYFGVNSLRDLASAAFIIPPQAGIEFKRAAHIFAENQRVLDAVAAMKQGDLVQLGQLMTASHVSLQKDYEVSCAELDFLVETANSLNYVYGSRMTGGGFGGCTVSLIDKDFLAEFTATLEHAYVAHTQKKLKVYVSKPAAGVHQIQ